MNDEFFGGKAGNNCDLHQGIIPETEGLMCAETERHKSYQKHLNEATATSVIHIISTASNSTSISD
jgi:hypothetical protein